MAEDENHLFQCGFCNIAIQGSTTYLRHIRNLGHDPPYPCGECDDRGFEHLTSLMRHIRSTHYPRVQQNQEVVDVGGPDEGNILVEQDLDQDMQDNAAGGFVLEDMGEEVASSDEEIDIDLARSGAELVLNLRQGGSITGSAIVRIQEEAHRMMQDVASILKQKVKTFLINQEIYTQEARHMLQNLSIEDPFENLKTIKQQLNYFATNCGLVKPETKFLKYRIDYRLNPETSQYEPTRVPLSFEYVSVIKTLTALLNNPTVRDLIASETASNDGVLRGYLDGSKGKSHPLVVRFPNIIRIQLYYDDIEVVNPLGSKTSIHKIAAFYFSIQNLPRVENSQLSSIYLVALAYSQDLKEAGSFEQILAPFLYELRKLESDRGVRILVDGQPYCLRATLTVFSADTLAAHEMLGFLAPSASRFCRRCMISREEFRQNINAMGEKRTRAMFDEHVERVSQNRRFSTQCGVRTSCPLHSARYFDATEDAVFDILHDLLEGVCHWVISLTLRNFVTVGKFFTIEEFNSRISAFNYGIPDSKNKPSANFSEKSLTGSKLKQKGSQMWCLTRVFGFIVSDVPADNPHLQLVNCLQRILLTVFSEEARQDHIDKLDTDVEDHHTRFMELHMTQNNNVLDELSDSEEEEEEVDDPVPPGAARPRRAWKKVSPGNKLHHMKHLAECFRLYGSLILYWCMRYEGRHHIFCKYGSVCCNFINIVKTMAQMFQISTLAGMRKTSSRAEDMELKSPLDISVQYSRHRDLLLGMGLLPTDIVVDVSGAQIAGEEYRPGLFVLTESTGPSFALIQQVYVVNGQVFLVLVPWETVAFEERYCAYRVEPSAAAPIILAHRDIAKHGAYAPWNPWNQRTTYIAPRRLIF